MTVDPHDESRRFDDSDRPRLRPVEAFPVEYQGKPFIALRDAANLSDRVSLITQAGLRVLEHLTGEHTICEIAQRLGLTPAHLQSFLQQLDEALLLHGARFEAHRRALLEQFDAMAALPIRSAKEMTRETMNAALDRAGADEACQAFRASAGATPRVAGLVVPHLDLQRGMRNYGLGYHALASALEHGPTYDRVVVFGTNHFGGGTGVVMCGKAHESNAGRIPCDERLAEALHHRLGESLIEHRLDHLREHSVELQMPWLRHLIGNVPTLGFLVHDPTVNEGASYDGAGVGLGEFIGAMREALRELDGRTLFIASADLSHVGPEFGDAHPNTSASLSQVEEHDRRHLQMLMDQQVDGFLRSMKANENATRWCTLGGMTALWRLLPESEPRLIRYEQAVKHPAHDDESQCCVSTVAMALLD